MLHCIITILGPVSGAHFNPIVSFAFVLRGELALSTAILFISVQILGGICGVWLTHAMFDQSIFRYHKRTEVALIYGYRKSSQARDCFV